mmetsp:Transcript_31449/g.53089  ORF Transcript_31449/g.53089 Transcript_31449/m.53089 type:complete len:325 (+) Transcript_31449:109-1083(+)
MYIVSIAAGERALPFIENTKSISSKNFLLSYPRGAYTTARTTSHRQSMFDLRFHVQRIADSVKSIWGEESTRFSLPCLHSWQEFTNAKTVQRKLVILTHKAIQLFESTSAVPLANDEELKVTVLVCPNKTNIDEMTEFLMYAHLSTLPCLQDSVCVQVRGQPRTNPSAKDSEWVRERQLLEEHMDAGVNEVLLADDDYRILEGLSSNFFAVRGRTIYTAGEGMLSGTMRRMVLDICGASSAAIEVILEAPSYRDAASWDGAFITSTSRYLLPIFCIQFPDDPSMHDVSYEFNRGEQKSVIDYLRERLYEEVDRNSTPLIVGNDG